jgi:hypothetical protein
MLARLGERAVGDQEGAARAARAELAPARPKHGHVGDTRRWTAARPIGAGGAVGAARTVALRNAVASRRLRLAAVAWSLHPVGPADG